MTEPALRVHGLKEVQKALFQYSDRMGTRIAISALRQGAAVVRRQVQADTPVLTGRLRRGYRVSKSKIHDTKGSVGVFLTLKKGQNAPYYGRFINKGTKHIKATHYFDRAFEQTKRNAVKMIIRTAEAGGESVKRRLGLK